MPEQKLAHDGTVIHDISCASDLIEVTREIKPDKLHSVVTMQVADCHRTSVFNCYLTMNINKHGAIIFTASHPNMGLVGRKVAEDIDWSEQLKHFFLLMEGLVVQRDECFIEEEDYQEALVRVVAMFLDAIYLVGKAAGLDYSVNKRLDIRQRVEEIMFAPNQLEGYFKNMPTSQAWQALISCLNRLDH